MYLMMFSLFLQPDRRRNSGRAKSMLSSG